MTRFPSVIAAVCLLAMEVGSAPAATTFELLPGSSITLSNGFTEPLAGGFTLDEGPSIILGGQPYPSYEFTELWLASPSTSLTLGHGTNRLIMLEVPNGLAGSQVRIGGYVDMKGGVNETAALRAIDGAIGGQPCFEIRLNIAIFDYAVSNQLGKMSITAAREPSMLYVWQDSPSPSPPHTTWATAATNIQDAVDAACAGDTVLVTNGVYATGGRAVYRTMTNRVAVDKPITLRSVNGPEVTVIEGHQVPGTINGDGAIRCVYLADGASLSGFTLTNGATHTDEIGGGLRCESTNARASNCVVVGNSAGGGGGAAYGTLIDCNLSDNVASTSGGGAFSSVLLSCTLTGNTADTQSFLFGGGGAVWSDLSNCLLISNTTLANGGGAFSGTLTGCTLVSNVAALFGGGVAGLGTLVGSGSDAQLNDCTLIGNSAGAGGGAARATLRKCMLIRNSADQWGGGAYGGTLNNCTLTGNSAGQSGGGGSGSTLNNCTLTGNSAVYFGGGVSGGTLISCTVVGNSAEVAGGVDGGFSNPQPTLQNCIVYHNVASSGFRPNYVGVVLQHCCTTPLQVGRIGCITNPPLFIDTNGWSNLRLQPNSPCIDAGNNDLVLVYWATDLDGNPRIINGIVDMGAYEFIPNSAPIADASATQLLWVSPNGLEGNVVLNGSRSSDPDGNPLTYQWFSGSTPIAEGVIAAVPLPVGVNAIDLVVDDGMAQDTNAVTVTVLTTEQAVQQLISLVNESNLRHKRPLLASLAASLASINRGNHNSATGQLGAFQNKVRAQVTDANLALAFLEGVEEIRAALQPDHSPRMAGNIHSFKGQNGKITVVIESPTHHLGDGSGNEGIVFEKSFFLEDLGPIATLEFDIVEPHGPNLESPPEVYINDLFAGSLGPFFPPLTLTQDEWVTNGDGSHDYNGGFHVSLPVTSLLVEGENLFRIQNGRPDDDYYFERVALLVVSAPTTVSLHGLGSPPTVVDDSPKIPGRIHSLKRHPNGRMHMKLSGTAGVAYIVEASTNLVDWKAVGGATVNEDGSFEFEDADAAKHQSRFYRVIEHQVR